MASALLRRYLPPIWLAFCSLLVHPSVRCNLLGIAAQLWSETLAALLRWFLHCWACQHWWLQEQLNCNAFPLQQDQCTSKVFQGRGSIHITNIFRHPAEHYHYGSKHNTTTKAGLNLRTNLSQTPPKLYKMGVAFLDWETIIYLQSVTSTPHIFTKAHQLKHDRVKAPSSHTPDCRSKTRSSVVAKLFAR